MYNYTFSCKKIPYLIYSHQFFKKIGQTCVLKYKEEIVKIQTTKLYKTKNPVTQVSYKKKTSKELKGLNYKSMGRDLITNQQMKLQNKNNTYLIISRNNYMHRYNNGIIYGKKGKTIFRKAMTKI